MVLSLRDFMVESNDEQSEENNDFLDQLQSFEQDNRRVITAIEIQKLEMGHREFVMNYFVYHQQTNSVAEYERSFLERKRWAEIWNEDKFDEKWVVSIFVKGLKEEIKDYVKLYCPDSLQRSIVLAKWREMSCADKVFDKSAEQEITQDESVTIGIIDESRISFGISFNAVANLNPDSIKLGNQASETFCANHKGLTIAVKIFDKSPKQNGYIACLNPKPPDVYYSLPVSEFFSPFLARKLVMGKFCTTQKGYIIMDQVFEKLPKTDDSSYQNGLYWGERGKFESIVFSCSRLLKPYLTYYMGGVVNNGSASILCMLDVFGLKAFGLRSQINVHDQGRAKVIVATILDMNKFQFSNENFV